MSLTQIKFVAQGKSHLVELNRDQATGGFIITVDGETRLSRGRPGPLTYLSESLIVSDRVCTVSAFSLFWGLYERYSISETRQKIR
jgi:hypothetical protein